MKNARYILVLITVLTSSLAMMSASPANEKRTASADSITARADYPQRLLTEFPTIYADTAYTTPRCHIVVRAVWMARRGRKCKVTTPEQLPEPSGASMVRFVKSGAK